MAFRNSLENFDKLEKALAASEKSNEALYKEFSTMAATAERLHEENLEIKAREDALCLAYEALQKEKDDLQTALETIVLATLAKEGAL
jgi:hypothetical protein